MMSAQKDGKQSFAAAIAIVGFVAAAGVFLPHCPDSFELPKRVVWMILALSLSLMAVFRRDRQRVTSLAVCLGTALLFYMVCKALLSGYPFWREAEPLLAWVMPICLFLSASSIDWTGQDARLVAKAVVALGVAEALLMILQRAGIDPLFGEVTHGFAYAPERMIGTIGYQNQAAELLGLAFFCIPACGFQSRAVKLSAAIAIVAAIILTANRGATVALVVAGGWLAWRRMHASRASAVKLAGTAILVGAAMMALPETRGRFLELVHPGTSVAVESRKWMGKVAASMFSDAPVFGCGPGEFAYSYLDRLGYALPAEKDHELLRQIVWAREAHNDPLQFLAEFGCAGFALLAIFAACAWRVSAFKLPVLFLTGCSRFSFSWQTSMAAPLAGLLLGIGCTPKKRTVASVLPLQEISLAFNASFMLLALALNWPNMDIVDAYFQVLGNEKALFLNGRMRFEAAKEAMRFEDRGTAFRLASEAERDFVSPDLISLLALTLQQNGRANEALAYWRRLERSGLMHEETLKHESRALEAIGQKGEAVAKEAERFKLWGNRFTDEELYRYCALSLMIGDAKTTEYLSGAFQRRCAYRGEMNRWTPEWSNLRGGALMALGRRLEAKPFFEDAINRKPSLDSAKRNLKNCQ